MANVITITETNFQSELVESKLPVLIDFWAPWCGYCTKLTPIFDELSAEMGEKVKFAKINVDENRAIAQQYNVMSLPTMLLIKEGKEVQRLMGFMPKATIVSKIEPSL